MPYRLDPVVYPNRAKIQFTTSAQMPMLVYRACLATGTISNTVYVQHAVCAALARDLGLDYDALVADLPEPRNAAKYLANPDDHTWDRSRRFGHRRILPGPANTIEEVG